MAEFKNPVYRVIVQSRGSRVPKVLVQAEGPHIQAWHPEKAEWEDAPWLIDYVYGDDINETVLVKAEQIEQIKDLPTLVASQPG